MNLYEAKVHTGQVDMARLCSEIARDGAFRSLDHSREPRHTHGLGIGKICEIGQGREVT
jgi:hypothetical protein